MKPYAQWTEAEVVEHVCREVPETVPSRDDAGVWIDDSSTVTVPGEPSYTALWFRAAMEWCLSHPLRRQNDGHGSTEVEYSEVGGWWVAKRNLSRYNMNGVCVVGFGSERTDPYPTSVHALGAACLLAAGKAVPE